MCGQVFSSIMQSIAHTFYDWKLGKDLHSPKLDSSYAMLHAAEFEGSGQLIYL